MKKDFDEIETINIELEHRVTRLITKNKHLKETYKYDSIKPSRVRVKEQNESLVNQVNQKLTATSKVPLRVPIHLEVVAPNQIVTRVYTRRPIVPKSVQHSKTKVAKSMTANTGTSRGSDTSVALSSSSLIDCSNDQVVKIMGYGDYQIGNVTIFRVYYVEGIGHNLFSVGQFCDSDLEVAF
nr:integrase, catalytic region, zinc finger, CCHC-type, peptidase aspartic, catalytic [Tanacetum cinerariifolium]